jgi:hypothetical protein
VSGRSAAEVDADEPPPLVHHEDRHVPDRVGPLGLEDATLRVHQLADRARDLAGVAHDVDPPLKSGK